MTASAPASKRYDAVVVGGGFYGCAIAVYLVTHRRKRNILLIDRENGLLMRASLQNQARVHNGYHYPRSFVTANRSRRNFPRFVQDWASAVRADFTKLYAIARSNSKVNASQFQRFCGAIGAPLEPAELAVRSLFDARLIEAVFVAQEYAFDARVLAESAGHELARSGVEVVFGTSVTNVEERPEGLCVSLSNSTGSQIFSPYVFNCTYSGLNQVVRGAGRTFTRLKHEITELAIVQPPASLAGFGVTVMDGPFFSMMPYPARSMHTLSHVRYTPHLQWNDESGANPYERLTHFRPQTHIDYMIRDAARYLPALLDSVYQDSLFEVKTVLAKNEVDDGRPILFETDPALPGYYAVLGGKIDNIYDVLERLRAEPLDKLS